MTAITPAPEPNYDGFVAQEHDHDYAGDTLLGLSLIHI